MNIGDDVTIHSESTPVSGIVKSIRNGIYLVELEGGKTVLCEYWEFHPITPPTENTNVNDRITITVERGPIAGKVLSVSRVLDSIELDAVLIPPAEVLFDTVQRLRRRLDMASRPDARRDEDGHCSVCGLEWPDPKLTEETHICPPGFRAVKPRRTDG